MPDEDLESPQLRLAATPVAARRSKPTGAERTVAFLEILLCSDYPTQVALSAALGTLGVSAFRPGGELSLAYVFALSLADTVLLVGLILFFLRAHGEDPRTVFFGRRPAGREILLGIGLTFVVLLIALAVLGAVLVVAPQLHTVPNNPLKDLMRTPREAAIFAIVVVVAGGVREELQRAFLLHRFDRWLGGARVGAVVTSVAFGLGHLTQGLDAVIATGVLGACWSVVYLRRRSAVAPMVSHAGFDLLQLLQFTLVGR